jgi:hypothetical protein
MMLVFVNKKKSNIFMVIIELFMEKRNTSRDNKQRVANAGLLLASAILFLLTGVAILAYGLLVRAQPGFETALLFPSIPLLGWIAKIWA